MLCCGNNSGGNLPRWLLQHVPQSSSWPPPRCFSLMGLEQPQASTHREATRTQPAQNLPMPHGHGSTLMDQPAAGCPANSVLNPLSGRAAAAACRQRDLHDRRLGTADDAPSRRLMRPHAPPAAPPPARLKPPPPACPRPPGTKRLLVSHTLSVPMYPRLSTPANELNSFVLKRAECSTVLSGTPRYS